MGVSLYAPAPGPWRVQLTFAPVAVSSFPPSRPRSRNRVSHRARASLNRDDPLHLNVLPTTTTPGRHLELLLLPQLAACRNFPILSIKTSLCIFAATFTLAHCCYISYHSSSNHQQREQGKFGRHRTCIQLPRHSSHHNAREIRHKLNEILRGGNHIGLESSFPLLPSFLTNFWEAQRALNKSYLIYAHPVIAPNHYFHIFHLVASISPLSKFSPSNTSQSTKPYR